MCLRLIASGKAVNVTDVEFLLQSAVRRGGIQTVKDGYDARAPLLVFFLFFMKGKKEPSRGEIPFFRDVFLYRLDLLLDLFCSYLRPQF